MEVSDSKHRKYGKLWKQGRGQQDVRVLHAIGELQMLEGVTMHTTERDTRCTTV